MLEDSPRTATAINITWIYHSVTLHVQYLSYVLVTLFNELLPTVSYFEGETEEDTDKNSCTCLCLIITLFFAVADYSWILVLVVIYHTKRAYLSRPNVNFYECRTWTIRIWKKSYLDSSLLLRQ
jgi:hypothetical protein